MKLKWIVVILVGIAMVSYGALTGSVLGDSASPPVERAYATDADFAEGILVGVETVENQLLLSRELATLPFIWVPNNEGTVSKVCTETGDELGRYRVAPPGLPDNGSPSRTTVDLEGNVWVGLRTAGTVVKVGLYEGGNYIDRNEDGVIQTSRDLDGDGNIRGAELLPWGEDECVLFEVVLVPGHEGTYVPGTYEGPYDTDVWGTAPRSLAVDADNNLWVGTGSPRKFYYIDGDTGEILKVIDVSPWHHDAYGATIDADGVIWSVRPLLRVDPSALDSDGLEGTSLEGHSVNMDGQALGTSHSGPLDVSDSVSVHACFGTNYGYHTHDDLVVDNAVERHAGMGPNPHFNVDRRHNSIWGHEWPAYAELTITIGDQAEPDFESTAQANEWGDFWLDTWPFDIQAGHLVTVTDDVTTKEHIVTSLTITEVNPDDDTVSGTADPGSEVHVGIHDHHGPHRTITVDADGNWLADFSVAIGPDPWQRAYDLGPGSHGNAHQRDEDGDATFVHWHLPNPHFNVDRRHNSIWGHEWPAYAELTITIGDQAEPDFESAAQANEWGDFWLDTWPFDIQAGHLVTVTDDVTTKEHIVTSLTITEVNPDDDTVSGTADPGSEVHVGIHDHHGPHRTITVDADGNWLADFSVAIDPDPWQREYDLGPGSHGSAHQRDHDGDGTFIGWHVPGPIRSVHLPHGPYALAPDYLGHLFVTGFEDNKLSKIDIETGEIIFVKDTPEGCARGVAVTAADNHVWVADTCRNSVLRYDNDGNLLVEIEGLAGPSGVAVDAAGKVWATDMHSEQIHRIDPETNTINLSKRLIGSGGHYSYSDMTGAVSRTITTKTGTWSVVYDSRHDKTSWTSLSWNSVEPEGTLIKAEVRSSHDKSTWSAWETAQNGVPLTRTPDGRYAEIRVTFQSFDRVQSPVLYDLTVGSAEPAKGCFIATAAYGTPMAEGVQILREFRDGYLLTNPVGQSFVDFYYSVSPSIAEFITEHQGLKPIVRAGLVPAVTVSTIVVNTTPSVKAGTAGLLVLLSVTLAVWATRRRGQAGQYA